VKLAFSKPTGNERDTRLLFSPFREIGYDGLQLKAGQYMPYLDEPERFLGAWGQLPGAASALIAGGNLDEDNVTSLRRVFAFGKAAGTELIVFCHGVPREGLTANDIRGFASVLSDLGMEARDHGLKLSLHHHFSQPVMHRDDFDTFFDAAEEGAVGLTVDTAHLVKSGVHNIANLIRDFRHVIDNFHLKDFADGAWKILGTGSIDFDPVFAAIRAIGYDGWISTDEESDAPVIHAMEHCFRFMTAGLAQK